MKIKKQAAGFTLIDLVVSMAVIGIGLAITIPTMREFTNVNRQTEQINRFVRDLTYAKSEAVTRGESFTVTNTLGTPQWDGGWTIADSATGLIVIRNAPPLTIAGQTLTSAGAFTTIRFKSDGTASPTNFTVELCKACVATAGESREKQVSVSNTGRISLNSQYQCLPAAPVCP